MCGISPLVPSVGIRGRGRVFLCARGRRVGRRGFGLVGAGGLLIYC